MPSGHFFTALHGEDVILELWDEAGAGYILEITEYETDAYGDFSGTFTVPAQSFRHYTIKADQPLYSISATDNFYINRWVVDPSSNTGPAGSNVIISGSGFTPDV